MSQSSFRDELAALKRENRQLLRELDILQSRRAAGAASTSDGLADDAGPNGHVVRQRDRNVRAVSNGETIASENGQPDPEWDLQAISETLNRFRAAFEDQWRGHSEDLGLHLDQLAAEVADLRSEVAAARASVSARPVRTGDASHRLILRPAEEPDEIVVDLTTDGIWQRLRRPWFYLPLLWGLIALTAALAYFVYFAG